MHGTINIIYKMFNFVFGKIESTGSEKYAACLWEEAVAVIDWRELIYVRTKPLTLGWQPQQSAWQH